MLRGQTPPEVHPVDVVEDAIRRRVVDDQWNGNYRAGAIRILYALQEEGHRVIYKKRWKRQRDRMRAKLGTPDYRQPTSRPYNADRDPFTWGARLPSGFGQVTASDFSPRAG